MHVLALDTTTRDGSVALADERRVIDERPGDGTRSHAERLPGELLALSEARTLSPREIDLFAVASGPGSFTGLRIGIATMQGLALAAGRRLVAVSALEALAHLVAAGSSRAGEVPAGTLVAAWMDARRHDVFAALYRVGDAAVYAPERVIEIEGPMAADPAATLQLWSASLSDARVVFIGDGTALYADIIEARASARWEVVADQPLLAGVIARIAIARAHRGDTIDPAAVRPLYVRRPDVEIERDRERVRLP
jgi:tRNA threonylcarbamoyladenosine biosynthesis protein TsaB